MRRGVVLLLLLLLATLAVAIRWAARDESGTGGGPAVGRFAEAEPTPPPVLVGTGESAAPGAAPCPGASRPAQHAEEAAREAPSGPAVERAAGPATLVVRVVDGQGRPRAGPRIRLYAPIDGAWTFTHDEPLDATGEIRFDDAHAGPTYLWIDTPGVSRSRRLVLDPEEPAEVEVVVPRGGTVTGTARHVEKGVLAGVDVILETREDEVTVHVRTRTDEEGRYRLEGVPPGTHGVSLRGMDIGYVQRPRAQVTVRDGETTTRDLVLGRVAVEGCVRDAVTGRPLAEVHGDLSGIYAPFSTDGTGTYRVLDLPPGIYQLWFARDGYQGALGDPVVVREGQVATCDVELDPAGAVVLLFLDPEGRPVAGTFELTFAALGAEGESVSTRRAANEHGIARFERIAPGTYEVRAERDGYRIEAARLEVGRDEASVELRCRPVERAGRPVLRGVVRDAYTRAPIAGVRLRPERGGGGDATTDERGGYAFWAYRGSPLRLIVSKDGYGIRFLRGIEVQQNEETVLDVELTPAAVLHLWITDARGAAVVGDVTLVIAPKERDGQATSVGTGVTADADGHAVYRQIVPGDYELIVIDPAAGRGSAEAAIRPGENTVRIRLE